MVSPYHPLFKGVFGFAGHLTAKAALADSNVDLVVAVGARFGEFSSNAWDTKTLLNGKLIHVESTEANLTRTPMARLHVRGCLETIFDRIVGRFGIDCSHYIRAVESKKPVTDVNFVKHFVCDDEVGFCSDATPIKPQRLMRDLPKLFPGNSRFLVDTGNSLAWGTHYLHPFDRRMSGKRDQRGGLFSASVDFASMGWAIGSAIGTALAARDRMVVCITGDGSWLMSGQELTVAVEEMLSVVFVILNDSAYGMVRHGQTLTGAEPTANQLAKVDFCEVSRSMGADAEVIESPEQLNSLDIKAICRRNGPTVLDVRIDPNEAPPIGLRTNVLQSG